MPILGPQALIDNVFPNGVDAALLGNLARETGVSDAAAVAQAAAIWSRTNQEFLDMYGRIVSFTRDRWMEYRASTGDAGATPVSVEHTRNLPIRGEQAGHMLPRHDFDEGVDFDFNFERRGNMRVLVNSLEEVAARWMNRLGYDVWTRALTNTEVPVAGGYSVGWAIGTGTNVNYIPPQYMGITFTSSHTHYLFQNSGAGGTYGLLFDNMLFQLRHHGYTGTATIFIGYDSLATVATMAGFARLEGPRVVVNTANTNSPARFVTDGELLGREGIPGEIVGYYNALSQPGGFAEVRLVPYIPAGYAFATQPSGIEDGRNAIAIYTSNDLGFGLQVEPEYRVTPEIKLYRVRGYATHGVGVGNRLNGVAGYIANGAASYVNPTIGA